MGFRREVLPKEVLGAGVLTAAMIGIGFRFTGKLRRDANLEDVLLFASIEGMDREQLRTLSLLTTWLSIHSSMVNVDRLTRLVEAQESKRVRAYWAAVGQWLAKDRRFSRLASLHRGERVDLLDEGTEFHIGRKGEDARFSGRPLRVPAGVLRDRPGDISPPEELAKLHRGYRWRVLIGPSFRADMFAALEATPALSTAELARRTYGSIATAFRVKREWRLLAGQRFELIEAS
jgi:hypothetical protein